MRFAGSRVRYLIVVFVLFQCPNALKGQSVVNSFPEVNYDEALVRIDLLPDPLIRSDGTALVDPSEWPDQKKFWIDLHSKGQFGVGPDQSMMSQLRQTSQVVEEGIETTEVARNGKATSGCIRRQLRLVLATDRATVPIQIALFLPADLPVRGCFVGLNFQGNHSISNSKEVLLCDSWIDNRYPGVVSNKATNAGRGTQRDHIPIGLITSQGYAVATAYYGDIDPDFDDGFVNGVHALFPHVCRVEPESAGSLNEAKVESPQPSWGAVAAWAWGLSRITDCILKQPELSNIDVFAFGHSRLGKTALWAGALDDRFQIVISNNSGCGGAAIERRNFGETTELINHAFPHWFCDQYKRYNRNNINEMPFDSHTLISSIAPRAVYIASASEDLWADPKGEYLGASLASPVYEFMGLKGLSQQWNRLDDSSANRGRLAYHLRQGEHDLTVEDWKSFLDYASHRSSY